jgi:hypothetical protein
MDFFQQLFETMSSGNPFGAGLCSGLVLALVIGFIGTQVLYCWNRILQFFAPTKPSFNPGPSAASRLGGCLESALWLILLGLAVVALVVIARPR